jgi:hypothetical protein
MVEFLKGVSAEVSEMPIDLSARQTFRHRKESQVVESCMQNILKACASRKLVYKAE